jgi:hypothetical protein
MAEPLQLGGVSGAGFLGGATEGRFRAFASPCTNIAQPSESAEGNCVQSEAISNHHK